jgi:hypothetical protein
MALRADVEALRDATIAALSAAHDHFVYTKKVWRIVDIEIRRRGKRIRLDNKVTGSVITERELLRVAQMSANDYLPAATIQQFASLTEAFLGDLVRLWLRAHPAHLKGQLDVQMIVAAPDKAAILQALIDQYVLAMSYKGPREWFKQLGMIVSLNHPTIRELDRFAEFKATRDAFVHTRGIATVVYLEKAGSLARARDGAPLDLPDEYVHEAWRLCGKIVQDVGTEAALKA